MKKAFAAACLVLLAVIAPSAHAGSDPVQITSDWAVARMVQWSPPGKSWYTDAKETEEEGTARYREIQAAAAAVAYDPSEPPIFDGKAGRARTMALILSVAYAESGYRKDVDLGVGKNSKGDGGRSWCMMQVQLGLMNPSTKKTAKRAVLKGDLIELTTDPSKGFGGEDLVADRQTCFRVGLHVIRLSFRACAGNDVEHKLAVYASGKCDSGWKESEVRVGRALKWLKAVPPPFDDVDMIAALHPSNGTSMAPAVSVND